MFVHPPRLPLSVGGLASGLPQWRMARAAAQPSILHMTKGLHLQEDFFIFVPHWNDQDANKPTYI